MLRAPTLVSDYCLSRYISFAIIKIAGKKTIANIVICAQFIRIASLSVYIYHIVIVRNLQYFFYKKFGAISGRSGGGLGRYRARSDRGQNRVTARFWGDIGGRYIAFLPIYKTRGAISRRDRGRYIGRKTARGRAFRGFSGRDIGAIGGAGRSDRGGFIYQMGILGINRGAIGSDRGRYEITGLIGRITVNIGSGRDRENPKPRVSPNIGACGLLAWGGGDISRGFLGSFD